MGLKNKHFKFVLDNMRSCMIAYQQKNYQPIRDFFNATDITNATKNLIQLISELPPCNQIKITKLFEKFSDAFTTLPIQKG